MKLRLQDTSRRFDQLFDQILNEHMGANKEEEYKDLVDVLLEVQRNGSDEMPLTTDNIQAIILVSAALITMCWFRINSHSSLYMFITLIFNFIKTSFLLLSKLHLFYDQNFILVLDTFTLLNCVGN